MKFAINSFNSFCQALFESIVNHNVSKNETNLYKQQNPSALFSENHDLMGEKNNCDRTACLRNIGNIN